MAAAHGCRGSVLGVSLALMTPAVAGGGGAACEGGGAAAKQRPPEAQVREPGVSMVHAVYLD
eukprot:COSAG01_NODE_21878_length_881_cov_1.098465_1_plen_62_part_00